MGALKKDWASPNSIALSWQEPEQTALPILDYEIKYYEKVQWLFDVHLCAKSVIKAPVAAVLVVVEHLIEVIACGS